MDVCQGCNGHSFFKTIDKHTKEEKLFPCPKCNRSYHQTAVPDKPPKDLILEGGVDDNE